MNAERLAPAAGGVEGDLGAHVEHVVGGTAIRVRSVWAVEGSRPSTGIENGALGRPDHGFPRSSVHVDRHLEVDHRLHRDRDRAVGGAPEELLADQRRAEGREQLEARRQPSLALWLRHVLGVEDPHLSAGGLEEEAERTGGPALPEGESSARIGPRSGLFVEPDVDALHQVAGDVDIVIFDERDPPGKAAIVTRFSIFLIEILARSSAGWALPEKMNCTGRCGSLTSSANCSNWRKNRSARL